MASRKTHKRRTAERKKRQRDDRALTSLRRQVRAYEGVSERRANTMSADECRATMKYGKRRPFYPDFTAGPALSIAAAGLLVGPLLRRTAR